VCNARDRWVRDSRADGRLIRLTVPVSDRPGGIAELTTLLAAGGASVKDIFHERAWVVQAVDQVVIQAVLETRGSEHNEVLLQALRKAGYVDARLSGSGACGL